MWLLNRSKLLNLCKREPLCLVPNARLSCGHNRWTRPALVSHMLQLCPFLPCALFGHGSHVIKSEVKHRWLLVLCMNVDRNEWIFSQYQLGVSVLPLAFGAFSFGVAQLVCSTLFPLRFNVTPVSGKKTISIFLLKLYHSLQSHSSFCFNFQRTKVHTKSHRQI